MATNTSTLSDIFAEWATIAPKDKAEPKIEYFDFAEDPLAITCALLRGGKQPYEAAEVLNGIGRSTRYIETSYVVQDEDRELANVIYDYFVKKHTMRRLKGQFISEYMLALDDLCDTRKRINKEHVGIIVSLPRIYEQNRHLEQIMKGRNSAPRVNNISFSAMHVDLEFVDKIRIKNGGRDEVHYFWSTPKNYLVRIIIQHSGYGNPAWDCFAKHGKIHLSTEVVHTYGIKGYDFNVIQPNPVHMEITTL